MEYSLPDLTAVRTFLRTACDTSIALDDLAATYVQAGADGPARLLYEAATDGGQVLRVAARRLRAAKRTRIEAAINARLPRPHPSSGFRQSAFYAPGLDLLFQVFPADESLPSLPTAIDESAMTAVLQQALVAPGSRVRLAAATPSVMRYKPGRKCLLRYDLEWVGDHGAELPTVVWARVARASTFARSRNVLPRLHAAAVDVGFTLPMQLGVVPRLSMELLGAVPGVVAFARVRRDDFPAVCRRIGEALWQFHELPVTVEAFFGVDAQLARLAENAVEFSWMLPAEADRIAAIEHEIAKRLRDADSPRRLIHRDFHGDNILLSDDGVLALLDFEDCAMGDPADDVGSNWAQLKWHAFKVGTRGRGPALGAQTFLDGYLDNGGAVMASRLPAYAAMHCFLYAHQCLRHPRDPARLEDARAMLALTVDVLERGLR